MLQKFVEKDKVSIVSRFFALQVVKPSMLIYATCLSAPVGVDDEHTRMTVRVDHLFYSHGRRVPSYFQQRQQELLQQQEMREQQLGTVTTSGATSEYTPAVVNVPIRDVLADVVEFGEVAKNELRVDDVICGVVVSRQDVERRRLAAKQSKHVSRRVDDESRSYSDGEDCSPTAALTAWDVADLTGDRILLSFDASLLRDAVILTRIHRLGKVSNETRQYVYQDQSPSDDDNDGSGATSFLPNLLTYLEMTNAIDPFVFQHTCQRLNVDQYASGVSELAGRRDLVARGQYERLRDEQNAAYAVHCVKRGVEKFHLYKQHITAGWRLLLLYDCSRGSVSDVCFPATERLHIIGKR